MKVVKSRAFKDRLKGHKESVISLFSPYGDQGHMLFSISRDGSARGWDLAKREITIKHLLGRQGEQKDPKQGKQIDDKQFQGKDQKKEDEKAIQRQQIISACFSQKAAYGSYQDGSIFEWNLISGDVIRQYNGHTKRISALAIIPGKNLLVSTSHDCTIRVWNIMNGQMVSVYKTSGAVNSMRINENNQILAIVNRNIFYQIDSSNNKILKCLRFQKHSITSFFFKDEILIFGNIQNRLLVYNLEKYDPQNPNNPLEPVKIIEGLGGWTLTLQFCNNYLYTGCDDRKIRVYKWPQIQEVQQLAGHDDGIISLSFADRMLYSGSFDHSIRSWDIKEMLQRISERSMMGFEDIESKKYQVYYGTVFKNKKKKLPAKKKKA